jgi:hypothetical protein
MEFNQTNTNKGLINTFINGCRVHPVYDPRTGEVIECLICDPETGKVLTWTLYGKRERLWQVRDFFTNLWRKLWS